MHGAWQQRLQCGWAGDRSGRVRPGQSAPGLALTERTEGSEAARITVTFLLELGPLRFPPFFTLMCVALGLRKGEKREVKAATLPHTLAFTFLHCVRSMDNPFHIKNMKTLLYPSLHYQLLETY